MEAAREGHDKVVQLLVKNKASVNALTEETNETALTLACAGGFPDVVNTLVLAGADIEAGMTTPLMEAAQEGHAQIVNYLIQKSANVNAETENQGDTPLILACENGHTECADILLSSGAHLEHTAENGTSSLHKAARQGHRDTVKFLIDRSCLLNKFTDNNESTALSLACIGDHKDVVEVLIRSGADPTLRLKDNSSCLLETSKAGHKDIIEILLQWKSRSELAAYEALNSEQTSSELQQAMAQQQQINQQMQINQQIQNQQLQNQQIQNQQNQQLINHGSYQQNGLNHAQIGQVNQTQINQAQINQNFNQSQQHQFAQQNQFQAQQKLLQNFKSTRNHKVTGHNQTTQTNNLNVKLNQFSLANNTQTYDFKTGQQPPLVFKNQQQSPLKPKKAPSAITQIQSNHDELKAIQAFNGTENSILVGENLLQKYRNKSLKDIEKLTPEDIFTTMAVKAGSNMLDSKDIENYIETREKFHRNRIGQQIAEKANADFQIVTEDSEDSETQSEGSQNGEYDENADEQGEIMNLANGAQIVDAVLSNLENKNIFMDSKNMFMNDSDLENGELSKIDQEQISNYAIQSEQNVQNKQKVLEELQNFENNFHQQKIKLKDTANTVLNINEIPVSDIIRQELSAFKAYAPPAERLKFTQLVDQVVRELKHGVAVSLPGSVSENLENEIQDQAFDDQVSDIIEEVGDEECLTPLPIENQIRTVLTGNLGEFSETDLNLLASSGLTLDLQNPETFEKVSMMYQQHALSIKNNPVLQAEILQRAQCLQDPIMQQEQMLNSDDTDDASEISNSDATSESSDSDEAHDIELENQDNNSRRQISKKDQQITQELIDLVKSPGYKEFVKNAKLNGHNDPDYYQQELYSRVGENSGQEAEKSNENSSCSSTKNFAGSNENLAENLAETLAGNLMENLADSFGKDSKNSRGVTDNRIYNMIYNMIGKDKAGGLTEPEFAQHCKSIDLNSITQQKLLQNQKIPDAQFQNPQVSNNSKDFQIDQILSDTSNLASKLSANLNTDMNSNLNTKSNLSPEQNELNLAMEQQVENVNPPIPGLPPQIRSSRKIVTGVRKIGTKVLTAQQQQQLQQQTADQVVHQHNLQKQQQAQANKKAELEKQIAHQKLQQQAYLQQHQQQQLLQQQLDSAPEVPDSELVNPANTNVYSAFNILGPAGRNMVFFGEI